MNVINILKQNIKSSAVVKKIRGYKKNIFNTNYNRSVLISYIVYPIYMKENKTHSNIIEVNCIVEYFKNKKYNVDIVDYDYKGKINFEEYNIVFGLGEPLEKAIANSNINLKKIFYATGQNPYINNKSAIKRLIEFKKVQGIMPVESIRVAKNIWPLQLTGSDRIIALGNDFTINTFKMFYDGQVSSLNAPCYTIFNESVCVKNYNKAKKNFLWFGSTGAIHKGLDLVIEEAKIRKDINFHICGPVEREEEFYKKYLKKYINEENIKFYSFISLDSDKFRELLDLCAFVILPSCAEGQCTSVLNCMSGGLIPIVTKQCGIDIDEGNNGYLINELNIKSISNVINKVVSMEDKQIEEMSKLNYSLAKEVYSERCFKENLNRILDEIVD